MSDHLAASYSTLAVTTTTTLPSMTSVSDTDHISHTGMSSRADVSRGTSSAVHEQDPNTSLVDTSKTVSTTMGLDDPNLVAHAVQTGEEPVRNKRHNKQGREPGGDISSRGKPVEQLDPVTDSKFTGSTQSLPPLTQRAAAEYLTELSTSYQTSEMTCSSSEMVRRQLLDTPLKKK